VKRTLVVLGVLIVVNFTTCLAEDNQKMTPDDRYIDCKLFQGVASNTAMSLEFASKSDAALDKMLLESKDKISASFIAAKISWLLGRPSKAICILEDFIQNHGSSEVRKEGGLPVAVAAKFWLATIARHYGDTERAKKVYAEIVNAIDKDDVMDGLSVFCYLYIGEIESVMLGNQDNAVSAFQRVGKVKQPSSKDGKMMKGWNICQEWAEYQTLCIQTEKDKARMSLKGNSYKLEMCIMLADGLLRVDGIIGQPRADFYDGKDQNLLVTSLDHAIESRTSPIDKSLSQLRIADIYERSKELAKAEKYYRALFEGYSFFAPEGGVFLARCQKNQGKVDESAKTFMKIKQRFPGYQQLVDELTK
jgi:TolA-binding protein